MKKKILTLIILLFTLLLSLNLIFKLPLSKLKKPCSVSVYSSEEKLLRVFISPDGRYRMKVRLGEIEPFLTKAIIAYEDRYFFYHFGVNPFSLWRAFITNLRAKRIICGGSTITMQIARMMEPKQRDILSKIIEIGRAIQLELKFSKQELLELYLNLAPYGGNIEGVKAASYLYFGKPPSQLSQSEVCLLVALPRHPEKVRPDKYLKNAYAMRKKVAQRLLLVKIISKKTYEEIINQPIPKKRRKLPLVAAHLADMVKLKYPHQETIVTTLDYHLQMACEKLLREYLLPLRKQNITQGSIVVIENKTHQVKSLVGSVEFFDQRYSGEVNGAISPRSPGSTLKPFLYALALDEGIITPKMALSDTPVDYSGYAPANYDGKYRGIITVTEALFQSRNIPAITLYAKLKDKFFNLLKEGGLTTLTKPSSYYGLALILGSCEVNLLELTNLYATVANLGRFSDYSLVAQTNLCSEKRLFSQASCYLISEMLSQGQRADLSSMWEKTIDLPKIAWKTGTSYGRRDAWSIGYNPDYTVGIWIGNFSGEGHENLIGKEVADPLLFSLFNYLTKRFSSKRWYLQPKTVEQRDVCEVSGLPPNEFCPVTITDFYIPGVSTNKKCDFHKLVLIDNVTGQRLCPLCKGNRGYQSRLVIQYPPHISTYFQRHGYPIDILPPHYFGCATILENKSPVIRSPSNGCIYYLTNEIKESYQKILFDASTPNSVSTIHWLVDDKLLFSVPATKKVFYTPTPGKHKIICLDEEGNSSESLIQVIKR